MGEAGEVARGAPSATVTGRGLNHPRWVLRTGGVVVSDENWTTSQPRLSTRLTATVRRARLGDA